MSRNQLKVLKVIREELPLAGRFPVPDVNVPYAPGGRIRLGSVGHAPLRHDPPVHSHPDCRWFSPSARRLSPYGGYRIVPHGCPLNVSAQLWASIGAE